tara:strand:- start:652 stop:1443 length:792 start_codon:yes stop_codon:yes gene_type:complete
MSEEVTEAREEEDSMNLADRVMILFMGRNFEHAKTSFQYYSPDAVHLITSDEMRKPYLRRLGNWSKSYGFRKGTVQSISDLFEGSSVNSLLSCVFRVVSEEHKASERPVETHTWTVGLTGGTMHMAAVATLASNALDATAFYVTRPKEGEAIMPRKQIFEMPTLISLKTAMVLSPGALRSIMDEGQGELPDLIESTGVEPWLVSRLEASGILETHPSRPVWRLTTPGKHILAMVSSGPMFGMRMIDENRDSIRDEGYDGAFHV